jgi:hypothetical protein
MPGFGTPVPLVPLAGRNPDGRPSGPTVGVAPLFGPPLRWPWLEPFAPGRLSAGRLSAGRLGLAGWDPVE